MKREILTKKYLETHRNIEPTGTNTWVFHFFINNEQAGKFSCIGDYDYAKQGALRFMKLGGYEHGELQA